jgi:NosR/NirI family nitrous oxide reductase transcriptional regulator
VLGLALGACLVPLGLLAAQRAAADLQGRLKTLFPAAAAFSPKQGEPPHYVAYGQGAEGSRPVLGYAYWTTDLVPLERGYSGPIAMLVGITPKGTLTGLVMGDHKEPYGYFSIDRQAFAAQFRGKDVRDPFLLGGDIDAVSTATITMSSAVRAIRNSSRRVARALLPPPGSSK